MSCRACQDTGTGVKATAERVPGMLSERCSVNLGGRITPGLSMAQLTHISKLPDVI